MYKKIILIVAIIILYGCGSDGINTNQSEENFTPRQREIISEYTKLNDEGKPDLVIFKYKKEFIEGQNYTDLNYDIKVQYNRAVEAVYDKGIDEFYEYFNDQIDYTAIEEETYRKIIDEKEKLISELKSEISAHIVGIVSLSDIKYLALA